MPFGIAYAVRETCSGRLSAVGCRMPGPGWREPTLTRTYNVVGASSEAPGTGRRCDGVLRAELSAYLSPRASRGGQARFDRNHEEGGL